MALEIPEQVRTAAANSDTLIKQLQSGVAPAAPAETPAAPSPAAGAPPTAPPAATPPADPSKPDSPAAPQPPAQPENWEQKYKTLQGKYNAEIPRLTTDLREARGQLQALNQEVERLKAAGSQPKPAEGQQPPSGDTPKVFKKEDIAQYGDEFGTLYDTLEAERRQNQELRTKLANLETVVASIHQDRVMSGEEKFFDALVKEVPNWEQINHEPGFHAFLSQIHPYTGRPRHDSLTKAREGLRHDLVIQIFKEYAESAARVPGNEPAPPAPPAPTPPAAPPPNRASANPDGTPTGKVWTKAEVARLYTDKTRGLYRGRESEFAAQEADLFQAQKEGRFQA